jgi:hypothetical protein
MRKNLMLGITLLAFWSCTQEPSDTSDSKIGKLNLEKDLLLANFDCKTDVDDIHTVAAFATLLKNPRFEEINYHAVAGAYGKQEGLYVPANSLFAQAFGNRWSDAHGDFDKALQETTSIVLSILEKGGDIWIAEAGQSDFSAALVKEVQKKDVSVSVKERFHIVQHSKWNEKETTPESLDFVKKKVDYHKIPDGNRMGNGTPGFQSKSAIDWQNLIKDKQLLTLWGLATEISNKFNGAEGRYTNKAIANGGLDFSDLSEVCWILGIDHLKDANQFFEEIAK